jgi:hypothetical protein
MKLELFPLAPSEEQHAWSLLPTHCIQRTLHNELVRKILSLRDLLETTAASEIPSVQAQIKVYRHVLGLLHRNDKLETK